MVHADFKPDNVLVRDGNVVAVVDIGNAGSGTRVGACNPAPGESGETNSGTTTRGEGRPLMIGSVRSLACDRPLMGSPERKFSGLGSRPVSLRPTPVRFRQDAAVERREARALAS